MDHDEERMQRLLDDHPEDAPTRLILADLLEERGDTDAARCQRWLGREGKWPDSNLKPLGLKGWHWWSKVHDPQQTRVHAELPVKVQTFMPQGEWIYPTRREAEEVLARALAAMEATVERKKRA